MNLHKTDYRTYELRTKLLDFKLLFKIVFLFFKILQLIFLAKTFQSLSVMSNSKIVEWLSKGLIFLHDLFIFKNCDNLMFKSLFLSCDCNIDSLN